MEERATNFALCDGGRVSAASPGGYAFDSEGRNEESFDSFPEALFVASVEESFFADSPPPVLFIEEPPSPVKGDERTSMDRSSPFTASVRLSAEASLLVELLQTHATKRLEAEGDGVEGIRADSARPPEEDGEADAMPAAEGVASPVRDRNALSWTKLRVAMQRAVWKMAMELDDVEREVQDAFQDLREAVRFHLESLTADAAVEKRTVFSRIERWTTEIERQWNRSRLGIALSRQKRAMADGCGSPSAESPSEYARTHCEAASFLLKHPALRRLRLVCECLQNVAFRLAGALPADTARALRRRREEEAGRIQKETHDSNRNASEEESAGLETDGAQPREPTTQQKPLVSAEARLPAKEPEKPPASILKLTKIGGGVHKALDLPRARHSLVTFADQPTCREFSLRFWKKISSSHGPTPRFGHSVCAAGPLVFLFGGFAILPRGSDRRRFEKDSSRAGCRGDSDAEASFASSPQKPCGARPSLREKGRGSRRSRSFSVERFGERRSLGRRRWAQGLSVCDAASAVAFSDFWVFHSRRRLWLKLQEGLRPPTLLRLRPGEAVGVGDPEAQQRINKDADAANPLAPRPCARSAFSLSCLKTPSGQVAVVLYGGFDLSGDVLKDVWLFEFPSMEWRFLEETWVLPWSLWFSRDFVTTKPPPRAGHSACVRGEVAAIEAFEKNQLQKQQALLQRPRRAALAAINARRRPDPQEENEQDQCQQPKRPEAGEPLLFAGELCEEDSSADEASAGKGQGAEEGGRFGRREKIQSRKSCCGLLSREDVASEAEAAAASDCVLKGASILVFGGLTAKTEEGAELSLCNELWEFFVSENAWVRWHTSGEPPEPRFWHSAEIVGDSLFVFGGRNAAGKLCDERVFRLHLLSREWREEFSLSRSIASPLPLDLSSTVAFGVSRSSP